MDKQFWARVNGGIVKRQLNEFSPVLAPAKKGVLINFVTNCHELHNENAIEICNKLPPVGYIYTVIYALPYLMKCVTKKSVSC